MQRTFDRALSKVAHPVFREWWRSNALLLPNQKLYCPAYGQVTDVPIGGSWPGNAVFVPPPPQQVPQFLGELERFIHAESAALPPLIIIALVHAQFETIHPFLDGNGRIDRLLITALLEHYCLLQEPLLYLSGCLKRNQTQYYRLLSATRTDGNWEAWISFFLVGVTEAAACSTHARRTPPLSVCLNSCRGCLAIQ